MALTPGTRLGPYEIVEPLGAGGMGEVYRARDPRLGRDVAVKLVSTDGTPSPDRLRRFETEARAAAQLSHPNVITVFDVGTHEGQPYLVLELLEGKTLREMLRRAPPSPRVAMGWGLECARGLGAAHDRGIVHRDLKPENIFLTDDGQIKILDFGLAKLHEPPGDNAEREAPTEAPGTKPGMVLGTVGYMAPEQVRGEKPDARTDVFALGAVLYELVTRRRPFEGSSEGEILSAILHAEPPPLVSSSGPVPPALEGVVRRCLEKDPRDRFHSAHGVALSLEAVREAPAAGVPVAAEPEERSPYPGLRFFTEEDAGRFFGREGEVESLWERLKTRALLAVIGPSGAGKSSFIRAGVVASRPTGWGALVCTPGSQAFRGLGEALAPELADDPDALRKLLEFEETAFELVTRWRGRHGEALLVVDQLEELFTLNSQDVHRRFAALLGRLSSEGDVHVLLSMRDDFLMRCSEHEVLSRVFTELTPLPPLGGEALRKAVEEPARREGFGLEEGLVEEMLQAVEGSRGALPLLAFAMSRLWQKRDRERKLLTRFAYEEIGGVGGALAQHAEQTLERIGPERQPLVRELFRNLVTAQGTRASSERQELLSVFEDREAAAEALQELIGARLLTSYEVREPSLSSRGASPEPGDEGSAVSEATHRIEVVHESLLKAWPRLVMWQAQDEEGAVLRDQLRQAARLWEERGRSPDVLWTGSALRDYEVWRERYRGNLTALEKSFAEAMHERESRRRRWRRIATTSVVVVSLAVAVVVGISRQQAVRQAERAEQAALRAEASQLLALAQARLEDDPTEALALTTASLELADTPEARVFAVQALSEAPSAREALVSTGDQVASDVEFSPDGRWLATIGFAEEGQVWSETGKGPIVLPGHEVNLYGGLQAQWLGEGHLATGTLPAGRIHVWSIPSGERVRTVDLGGTTWWWAGAGGRLETSTVVDGGDPGSPLVFRAWDIPGGEADVLNRGRPSDAYNIFFEPGGRGWSFHASGREVRFRILSEGVAGADRVLGRHSEEVEQLYEWSPDRLVSRDRGGETRVWWALPPEGPALERVIPHPPGAPKNVEAEPSGRWLYGPDFLDDRQVTLWDLTALHGARPLELRRSGAWSNAGLDFRPGGDWLVVPTHSSMRLTLWPLARRRPSVLDGFNGTQRALAFSPHGRWLAASTWNGDDEGVRLWPLADTEGGPARKLADGSAIGLAFDPTARHLLRLGRSGNTGRVEILALDGSGSRELSGPEGPQPFHRRIAVSPAGRRVATAFFAGPEEPRLKVWDLDTGELRLFELPPPAAPEALPAANSSVGDLHFVDESTLYTAGDGGLRRWDLETGTHEVIWAPEPEEHLEMSMDARGTVALTHVSFELSGVCRPVELHEFATGEHRPLPDFGGCVTRQALDPSGRVAATGDRDGVVRVGRVSGGAPHLLLGHEGPVQEVRISPDLRWVGSMGEDNTLRLWPMPDLETPPLHALPRDELIAKLKTLTNLRAVRDPDDPTGWTIALDPFPGWRDAPEW